MTKIELKPSQKKNRTGIETLSLCGISAEDKKEITESLDITLQLDLPYQNFTT